MKLNRVSHRSVFKRSAHSRNNIRRGRRYTTRERERERMREMINVQICTKKKKAGRRKREKKL